MKSRRTSLPAVPSRGCEDVELTFPSTAAQTAGLSARRAPSPHQLPRQHKAPPGSLWVLGGVSSPWHWRPFLSLSHLTPAPCSHVICCSCDVLCLLVFVFSCAESSPLVIFFGCLVEESFVYILKFSSACLFGIQTFNQ